MLVKKEKEEPRLPTASLEVETGISDVGDASVPNVNAGKWWMSGRVPMYALLLPTLLIAFCGIAYFDLFGQSDGLCCTTVPRLSFP